MSLIDFVEKLQKKPRYVRVQIMWLVVGVCMIFIFLGWLWSLTALNTKIISPTDESKSSQGGWQQFKQDVPTLWSSLSAGIGNIFNSVKEGAQQLQNEESVSPTPSPLNSDKPMLLPIE